MRINISKKSRVFSSPLRSARRFSLETLRRVFSHSSRPTHKNTHTETPIHTFILSHRLSVSHLSWNIFEFTCIIWPGKSINITYIDLKSYWRYNNLVKLKSIIQKIESSVNMEPTSAMEVVSNGTSTNGTILPKDEVRVWCDGWWVMCIYLF